jgi:hypothetical protein
MALYVLTRPDRLVQSEGTVKEFSPQEKTIRALKVLGAFWGAAVVSILIPVLHFVLVPGFFIIGPIMANVKRNQQIEIENARFPCPECKKELEFKKISGNWPIRQTCPNCSSQLYFQKEISG